MVPTSTKWTDVRMMKHDGLGDAIVVATTKAGLAVHR
jgi:hypothetical protein